MHEGGKSLEATIAAVGGWLVLIHPGKQEGDLPVDSSEALGHYEWPA